MGDVSVRRAARLTPPSWLDARLLLGVVMVLAAVVAGARVFASADRWTDLYVAAHPLVPGEQLTAADVTVGQVRLDGEGTDYIAAAAAPPVGYVVSRYIGTGEFIPAHAVSVAAAAPPLRMVTLPVEPGHLPPDVGPGSSVDVYVSPKGTGAAGAAGPTRLVAGGLAVQSRDGGEDGLSGSSVLSVVVAVPAAEVPKVVEAAESGAIDVVVVPAGDGTASASTTSDGGS